MELFHFNVSARDGSLNITNVFLTNVIKYEMIFL